MKTVNREYVTRNGREGQYVRKNGVWTFNFIGDKEFVVETYDECFTSTGVSIGEKLIDSTIRYEENQEIEFNHEWSSSIIQIGYDFHLIPNCEGTTIEALNQVVKILNNSFKGKGDYNPKGYFNTIKIDSFRCDKGYYGDGFMYNATKEEKRKTEICRVGHSRLIYNRVEEVPTIKEYRKNFDIAMKKYTKEWQQDQIKRLYHYNVNFLTKAKKYLVV